MVSTRPDCYAAEDETFVLDGGELHAIDKGEDDEGDILPPGLDNNSDSEDDI